MEISFNPSVLFYEDEKTMTVFYSVQMCSFLQRKVTREQCIDIVQIRFSQNSKKKVKCR
jgi:hypothetical protein